MCAPLYLEYPRLTPAVIASLICLLQKVLPPPLCCLSIAGSGRRSGHPGAEGALRVLRSQGLSSLICFRWVYGLSVAQSRHRACFEDD
jgi:hypothetical protein